MISAALLDRRVGGVNLVPGTLRDQLGDALHLLVFLRHLGCVFCRETLADLRAAAEGDAAFPAVLFFFQGTVTEGRALLRRYGPQLRAISDEAGFFYEGFGIRRGGLLEMFGPSVLRGWSRAAGKGHRNGDRSGDVWRMPGMYLARGSQILWAHEYRHAADQPDYGHVRDLASAAGSS